MQVPGDVLDLDVARYRRNVEARTGMKLEAVIALALTAEAAGAPPADVRAVLDGDLTVADRWGVL